MAKSMETHRRVVAWINQSDETLRLHFGDLTKQEIGTMRAMLQSLLTSEVAQEMKLMEKELEELQKWKAETIEVESQWDVQAVGRAIGASLGERIRPAILPYIRKLQGELAEAREEISDLQGVIVESPLPLEKGGEK